MDGDGDASPSYLLGCLVFLSLQSVTALLLAGLPAISDSPAAVFAAGVVSICARPSLPLSLTL